MIICFDLTERETFLNLPKWLNDVKKFVNEKTVIIIIANKADDQKNREISKREIKEFEEDHKVKIFECSARTSDGVTQAFISLTKNLISEDNEHDKAEGSDFNLKRQRVKNSMSF